MTGKKPSDLRTFAQIAAESGLDAKDLWRAAWVNSVRPVGRAEGLGHALLFDADGVRRIVDACRRMRKYATCPAVEAMKGEGNP